MQILIDRLGQVCCLYSELIDLSLLGPLSIQRGSHVEPDEQGQWWTDLFPVRGPKLGPFLQRSVALAAEQQWLETNWLITAHTSLLEA